MTIPKYFVWEYRTIVELGSGCRTFAPQRFMEMGAKRVAIITDPGLVAAGIVNQVQGLFEVQGEPLLAGVYDRVEQDAVMRVVNDCARWCRENAIDGILALGGGSVLDSAKGVKLLLGTGRTDIKELIPGNMGPYIRPLGKPLNIPSVYIPTTAGTGSEVSPLAVIYNEEQKIKANITHPYIPADYALLDPDLTVGLSPFMTACTGFDALAHAVEGLSSPGSNCMSDSLAIQAIKLIVDYLPIAVNDGKDLEARSKMLAASNMAIMSFSMSGLFFPIHNIAHAAEGQLHIAHGQAVGVAMPAVMGYAPWYYIGKAKELSDAFACNPKLTAAELVSACREKVLDLMQSCNFIPRFDETLDEQGLKNMFWAVKNNPSGLVYPLPDDTIKECIQSCFSHK